MNVRNVHRNILFFKHVRKKGCKFSKVDYINLMFIATLLRRQRKVKKFLFLFVAAVFSLAAGEITVYRNGREAWIQSRFSEKEDVVIGVWRDVNERAYLVPRGSDIRNAENGKLLHRNGDEYPAVLFGNYGYLSGNHGSVFARKITAPGHGFVMADSGKVLTDETDSKYVLVKVKDKNTFIIHPLNKKKNAPVGRPVLSKHRKQKLFFNGREIRFASSAVVQLRPLNVIKRSEFLVDGRTPLPDKTVVKCKFLDHVFEHEVIAPEAAAEYIVRKSSASAGSFFTTKAKMYYPQDEPEFADYTRLPVILQVKDKMRYQANGAMVNYRSCRYPVSLPRVSQLEMMFGWTGLIGRGAYQKFYIPKTVPVEFSLRSDKSKKIKLDFVRGVDISKKLDLSAHMTPAHAADPACPPDRFIRVTGAKSPEYGIALGYSMLLGQTALENKGALRDIYYYHWHTRKMYPYAYVLKNNKQGILVDTVSYKQYFSPSDDPDATAFYYHRQGDSTVVYFETHKKLSGKKLALPPEFAGRKFSVIEKTPSVVMTAEKLIPASGLSFDVTDSYGHLVLKID